MSTTTKPSTTRTQNSHAIKPKIRLRSRSINKRPSSLIRSYFSEEVAHNIWLETELIILTLSTGIMDAISFPQYRVFASNQTGNTALLAVGALGLAKETVDLRDVSVSLGVFMAGGLILGQLGSWLGPSRRGWLLFTNFSTTLCVVAAGVVEHWFHSRHGTPGGLGIIALLAFASGGQIAFARTVNVPEITTSMVTSAYIDFLVDGNLLKVHNRPRNRRLFLIVTLLLGSFIGAIGYRYVNPAFSLLLSALAKLIVCAMLLFHPASKISSPAEEV